MPQSESQAFAQVSWPAHAAQLLVSLARQRDFQSRSDRTGNGRRLLFPPEEPAPPDEGLMGIAAVAPVSFGAVLAATRERFAAPQVDLLRALAASQLVLADWVMQRVLLPVAFAVSATPIQSKPPLRLHTPRSRSSCAWLALLAQGELQNVAKTMRALAHWLFAAPRRQSKR